MDETTPVKTAADWMDEWDVKDGKFKPFAVLRPEDSDFDWAAQVDDPLALSAPQSELLWRMLKGLEIQLWPSDEPYPRLELICFWDDGEATVAKCDLQLLLTHALDENALDIEDKDAIAVLTRLQELISRTLERLQK